MKKGLNYLHLLLAIFLFASCSEKEEEVVVIPKQKHNSFLLKMQHFGDRSQMEPSFPVWFDDSIVKSNGISVITRRMVSFNNPEDTLDDELSEEHVYRFTKKGALKDWRIRSFYDNLCFETVTITYDFIKITSTGHCPIKSVKTEHFNGGLQNEELKRYYTVERNDQVEIYGLNGSSRELMFMKDSLYWGAISIDTLLHPEPEDVIVLGTPIIPLKSFQVENTVKYFNVIEYEYTENSLIRSMVEENYPFITKRSVNYALSGDTEGFVDSIFIDDKYLSKKEYKFRLMESGLPLELNRWLEEGKKKTNIEQETFIYEYFEKD
jgi:hypothetical protein